MASTDATKSIETGDLRLTVARSRMRQGRSRSGCLHSYAGDLYQRGGEKHLRQLEATASGGRCDGGPNAGDLSRYHNKLMIIDRPRAIPFGI